MTFGTAFYLFVLPLAIAAGGALIAYFSKRRRMLHPGE